MVNIVKSFIKVWSAPLGEEEIKQEVKWVDVTKPSLVQKLEKSLQMPNSGVRLSY
jgi:hypothetical protein